MNWQDFLEANGFDDWEVSPDGVVFTCPCGDNIEPDGRCPEGHESPLLVMGMV